MQEQTEPVHVSVGLSCDAQGRQHLADAPPVGKQAARARPQTSDRHIQPTGMPPCSHDILTSHFFKKQHMQTLPLCITCSTEAPVIGLGRPSGGLHSACSNTPGHLPGSRLQHVVRLAGSTAAE